jgi:hypothetical protein
MEAVLFDENRREREAKAASDEARTTDVTSTLGREISDNPEAMAAESARLDSMARDPNLTRELREDAAAKSAVIKSRMAAAETGTAAEKPMSDSAKASSMRFAGDKQRLILTTDSKGEAFAIPDEAMVPASRGSASKVVDPDLRLNYEYQAVLRSTSEDDYVKKGFTWEGEGKPRKPLTPAQQRARRDFYRSVMQQQKILGDGGEETAPGVPGASGID